MYLIGLTIEILHIQVKTQKRNKFNISCAETQSIQQVVELPIIKRERCIQVYSDIIPVTQDHLCVGGEENKDACSGFGGAPLVYLDRSEEPKYYQVFLIYTL